VVVAASPVRGRKGFVWTIIRDDENRGIVRQSEVSYRSMEEAYTEGAKALTKLRPSPRFAMAANYWGEKTE
jgi:hypothetical protein